MSKQVYEEAIADVKKVKQVAEDNAKRAVLEAVAPRIRDLIENELLKEAGDFDDDDDSVTDLVTGQPGEIDVVADAITPPDAEGKVTLDLDALSADDAGVEVEEPIFGDSVVPQEEYEMSLESVQALTPILNATKVGAVKDVELQIYRLKESVERFKSASVLIKRSIGYKRQISDMISRVENIYDYVQESVGDLSKRSSFEVKLESCFGDLKLLREQKMLKNKKKLMNEEDVTLKLTGLPDDLDLDSVGVDLITGEDDDDGDLDSDDGADDGEDGGDELDLDSDDGDEGSDEEEGTKMENRRLSDDTIVEIDENMLRREIARMKVLREETKPGFGGNGVSKNEFDNFGGATEEGEPLDVDVEAVFEPLGESDEMDESDDQMDEVDQMDEMDELDELDQLGEKRKEEQFGSDDADSHSVKAESLRRKLSFEKRLQERARRRAVELKNEAKTARMKRNLKLEASAKKKYALVARQFNESVARAKKFSKLISESAQRLQNVSRLNSGTKRPAGMAEQKLRKELAESNLNNTKLLYTNKLLQNESLNRRQKAQIIERLDEAKTVREAKLIYESISKTLSGPRTSVNESTSRTVLGSASRATRPASTSTLNEGYEAERWAKLAGIVK